MMYKSFMFVPIQSPISLYYFSLLGFQAQRSSIHQIVKMYFTSLFSIFFVATAPTALASPFPDPKPQSTPPTMTRNGIQYSAGQINASSSDTTSFAWWYNAVGVNSSPLTDINLYLQSGDGNFVAYNGNHVAMWSSYHIIPAGTTCGASGQYCRIQFQTDGNLVVYYNHTAAWYTGTGAGIGAWLQLYYTAPYIVIVGQSGQTVWSSS
jgi:hypothetical protein